MDTNNQITNELQTVEPSKADEIRAIFAPMADTVQDFETRFKPFKDLKDEEITPEQSTAASVLRKEMKKVRSNVENERKRLKEPFLRTGKAIDGIANIYKAAMGDMETRLEHVIKITEVLEQKRIDRLQIDRGITMAKYMEEVPDNLGTMEEDVFMAYYEAKKKAFEDAEAARIEAERKAEEQKVIQELHEDRKNTLLDVWTFLSEDDKQINFGLIDDARFGKIWKEAKEAKNKKDNELAEYQAKQKRLRELRIERINQYNPYLGFYAAEFKGEIEDLSQTEFDEMIQDAAANVAIDQTRTTEIEELHDFFVHENFGIWHYWQYPSAEWDVCIKDAQELKEIYRQRVEDLESNGFMDTGSPIVLAQMLEKQYSEMLSKMIEKREKEQAEKERIDKLEREEVARIEEEKKKREAMKASDSKKWAMLKEEVLKVIDSYGFKSEKYQSFQLELKEIVD